MIPPNLNLSVLLLQSLVHPRGGLDPPLNLERNANL